MGEADIAPVTIGYYRYTDVWFEWHQSLPNPDDAGPLKAVFAHDSLVHPESPLHKDGVEGIEMHMGTLLNGESRLLFSSAQVEYVRYWLHAMRLTENPIPIPYSNCLLTSSDLRQVSPVVFKNGFELKQAVKEITKNNKRLKGGMSPYLNTRRDLFERVRTFWSERAGVWCAIDFEAWDRDHTCITEIGWSAVRWEGGKEVQENCHLIVKENQLLPKNVYGPTQHPEQYNAEFGTSEIVKKPEFKKRIQDLIARFSKDGPLFLIFHDSNNDIKYLRSKMVEAPLKELQTFLPDVTPDQGIFAVDTCDLFAALEGDSGGNKRSLERVCKLLDIDTEYLHNAGNDAFYTLRALRLMASGEPLDIQRERRWPNRDKAGLRVQFKPSDEDSDLSDMEGIFPPPSGYDPKTGELATPMDVES